jgi:hypothetical protein
LKQIVEPSNVDLDWMGIAATRLNAEFVRICFGDLAFEIRKYIFDQSAAHADETTVQVLKEPGKKAQSTSYMWVACSSKDACPAVWFQYSPDRSGSSESSLIGKYSGILHVDGFTGYNSIIQSNGIKFVSLVSAILQTKGHPGMGSPLNLMSMV